MAEQESKYPGMDFFAGIHPSEKAYPKAMSYLSILAMDPKSNEGQLFLRKIADKVRERKEFAFAVIGAFLEAITCEEERFDRHTLVAQSAWAGLPKQDPESRTYDNPNLALGELYRFMARYGSVNNLPVTEYTLAHGPHQYSFRTAHPPAKFSDISTGDFTEWPVGGLRIAVRGTKGAEIRRNQIAVGATRPS